MFNSGPNLIVSKHYLFFVGYRLYGKVALITGGASGLGECTTRLFVKHGAKVLIADIQDDLGHSLCQDLGPENISYDHCDVTCESDVENVVNLVVSKYGKLDIMFNNAGIIGDNEVRVTDTSTETFKRVFDINMLCGFLGAKHAARVMVPAKKGCILCTSSHSSKINYGNLHAYKASKHAVTGLTKSLSVELSEHGIRVNCISPHAIAITLFQKTLGLLDKKKGEEMIAASAVLKGTVLEPEDFANAAMYLVSDEAKYVSGVNLPIDGGYCLNNQSWKLGFVALSQ
ncbi:secoisolariciresinol dehydrogenase-like [Hibiscus syriacus]|uniref:secoisolariciresinol dehydrogenase-like n=1 Tax=Hibiscus syriacus TaxID=106335 RepID=UPI0019210A0B|nr:secoisolariciresinol dehydrogenase-like [Hibiscus syriacus]